MSWEFLKFSEYIVLNEATLVPPGNNTKGVLHELLTGYHLKGSHMNVHHDFKFDSPKIAHDKLKLSMSPQEYQKINAKAKAAAKDIASKLNQHGTIKDVHWTSKEGDITKTTGIKTGKHDDPSDIVVTTQKGRAMGQYHGISLKVTEKNKGDLPVSNPGLEKIPGGKEVHERHKKSILKDYPNLAGKNKDQRKAILAKNEKMKTDIRARNSVVLPELVKNFHAHLESIPKKQLANHIRYNVIQAKMTPMQKHGHTHMKHTTYGNHETHSTNPATSHDHILNDHNNISVDSSGTSVIFKHKGKAFAKHRFKFESQSDPLGGIKGSGELV